MIRTALIGLPLILLVRNAAPRKRAAVSNHDDQAGHALLIPLHAGRYTRGQVFAANTFYRRGAQISSILSVEQPKTGAGNSFPRSNPTTARSSRCTFSSLMNHTDPKNWLALLAPTAGGARFGIIFPRLAVRALPTPVLDLVTWHQPGMTSARAAVGPSSILLH